MKKIVNLLLVMAMAFVAASCADKDNDTTPQPGDKDPLENCVLPESVKAGGEVLVQWDRFKENASIFLEGSDSHTYQMQIRWSQHMVLLSRCRQRLLQVSIM